MTNKGPNDTNPKRTSQVENDPQKAKLQQWKMTQRTTMPINERAIRGKVVSSVFNLMGTDFKYADKDTEQQKKMDDLMALISSQHPDTGVREIIELLNNGQITRKRFGSATKEPVTVILNAEEVDKITQIASLLGKPEILNDLMTACLYCKITNSNNFIDVVEEFGFIKDMQDKEPRAKPIPSATTLSEKKQRLESPSGERV